MIYAEDQYEDRREFENLLQLAKELTLVELSSLEDASSLSGAEFEELVYEQTKKASVGTSFEGKIKHTEDRAFPDIVAAGFFGIEVKATKKDDWTSIGNSVLESSRYPEVQKIYIFFGKLGGAPDIIYRDYESCLKGVAVTHYPRYQIDMKLAEDQSIFDKMGVSYDEIKDSENPVKAIRSYYKEHLKEGEGLWWIDDDLDKTATSGPVIRNLSSLTAEQKDYVKADIFVHFPEIFSNSTKKFERVPAYLASAHSVLSPNLRDFFTAGGQISVNHSGEDIKVAQIIGEARRLWGKISDILTNETQQDLFEAWQHPITEFVDPIQAWLDEVDNRSENTDSKVPISKLISKQTTDRK